MTSEKQRAGDGTVVHLTLYPRHSSPLDACPSTLDPRHLSPKERKRHG
jgi:hypothetical protein